jgi:hypothetical protein
MVDGAKVTLGPVWGEERAMRTVFSESGEALGTIVASSSERAEAVDRGRQLPVLTVEDLSDIGKKLMRASVVDEVTNIDIVHVSVRHRRRQPAQHEGGGLAL